LCHAAITPSVIVSLRRGIKITSAMFYSLKLRREINVKEANQAI
jgi:hypothetical protein